MRKLLVLILALAAFPAFAQSTVAPCVTIQNGYPSGQSSCQRVSSGNPLPVTGTVSATSAPAHASGAYAASTITNSSAQKLAADADRVFLEIKNQSSTATISCALGATAVIGGAGSYDIAPGWALRWDGNFVPTDAVNCISSVASSNATIGAY